MVRDRAFVTACMLGLSAVASACTGPVRLIRPRACPAQGLLNEVIPATLALPRPEGIFIPPMPISSRVRGNHAAIRLVVDTLGHVMRDSVTVCGVGDAMYAQRLAEEVSQLRFRPGLMNARHVIAPTLLVYDF